MTPLHLTILFQTLDLEALGTLWGASKLVQIPGIWEGKVKGSTCTTLITTNGEPLSKE